jgi:hypothetical protein
VQAVLYVRHRTQNSVATGSYVCVFASDITSHLPTFRHIYLHYVTFTYITSHLPTLRHIYLPYVTFAYITSHLPTLRHIYLHYVTFTYITSHLPTLRYIYLHYVTFTYIYFLTCLLNHDVFRNLAVPFLEQVTCGMYVQAFVMLYRLLE